MIPGRIENYRFGSLRLGDKTFTKGLIILPDRVVSGWRRSEGHRLRTEDLALVFGASPELLIIGSGSFGCMSVSSEAQRQLAAAGIEVVVQSTGAACRTFNTMRLSCRLAAALHLAC